MISGLNLIWTYYTSEDQKTSSQTDWPKSWLSPIEWDTYRSFRTPWRQMDWLAGRLAAKRAIQAALVEINGNAPHIQWIAITNLPNGAPEPCLVGRQGERGLSLPFRLSLSHRDCRGFAAVTDQESSFLGADLERIEKRSPGFADEFFTLQELFELSSLEGQDRDLGITLVWSAKEAALKALGVGLTVDTRSLSIHFYDTQSNPDRNWLSFFVEWDLKRWDTNLPHQSSTSFGLKKSHLQNLSDLPVLKGYWRHEGDYVLSLVFSTDDDHSYQEVQQLW